MNKQATLLDETEAAMSTPAQEPPTPRQEPMAKEPVPWSADDPDLVIVEQPATRIYLNRFGSIVITQESCYSDDDPYVHGRPESLSLLIEALERFLPR